MHEGPFDSATATFSPRRGHDRRRTTPTQRRRRGRVLRRWRSVRRDGRSTSTDRQSDADPLRAVAVVLRRRRHARRAAMAWSRPLQRALGPVAIAKSLPSSQRIAFAARCLRGLAAGANACGAAPRRLVELHECRVRCWALSSSGAARSKRSASDCCRWQLYAVESCGPGTRYRARLGTKSAKNPSCSPAQREEKRTARRGRAAVLKRYKPSHSSRHHGCFQQQR